MEEEGGGTEGILERSLRRSFECDPVLSSELLAHVTTTSTAAKRLSPLEKIASYVTSDDVSSCIFLLSQTDVDVNDLLVGTILGFLEAPKERRPSELMRSYLLLFLTTWLDHALFSFRSRDWTRLCFDSEKDSDLCRASYYRFATSVRLVADALLKPCAFPFEGKGFKMSESDFPIAFWERGILLSFSDSVMGQRLDGLIKKLDCSSTSYASQARLFVVSKLITRQSFVSFEDKEFYETKLLTSLMTIAPERDLLPLRRGFVRLVPLTLCAVLSQYDSTAKSFSSDADSTLFDLADSLVSARLHTMRTDSIPDPITDPILLRALIVVKNLTPKPIEYAIEVLGQKKKELNAVLYLQLAIEEIDSFESFPFRSVVELLASIVDSGKIDPEFFSHTWKLLASVAEKRGGAMFDDEKEDLKVLVEKTLRIPCLHNELSMAKISALNVLRVRDLGLSAWAASNRSVRDLVVLNATDSVKPYIGRVRGSVALLALKDIFDHVVVDEEKSEILATLLETYDVELLVTAKLWTL